MRGVDTATSTPQASVNSHSFAGSFTRATTRRTANTVFASSATTRLTLSSPVAAMTTSQSCMPASSSERQLARVGEHPLGLLDGVRLVLRSRSRSMSITWCCRATSSAAMDRPTAPAPAIATRI